jgi:formiminotetrahydrofolate cyclodeaminase
MAAEREPIGDFLDALGARTPAPASGAAAAVTGALGAALAELAARLARDEVAVEEARSLRARLVALADEDSEAYTAFLRERSEEARQGTIAVPLEIAACGDAVEALARRVALQLSGPVVGDAESAAALGRAAAEVSRRLADING